MKALRNVCIIAHVDHGKTTLVDFMLRQAGTFKEHETMTERVMDSMDLEREKGITILAKNTAITFNDIKINIVDTPGHADFGGEVERILGMVDGALLLVDAAEGPLPQTRFVLQKALQAGHRVIVVINKVDRSECSDGKRIQEVLNQTFDLFVELGANDMQAQFPIVFACARAGWCTQSFDEIWDLISGKKKGSLVPLFELIIKEVPPPTVIDSTDFQMLVSNLSYSDFVGQLSIGRVRSGRVLRGQKLVRQGVDETEKPVAQPFTATKVFTFDGLKQIDVEALEAGDIGIIAGVDNFDIGDTLASVGSALPALKRITVEKPTIGMLFSVNTSPFSGQEGEPLLSRKLRDRLVQEARRNVAVRFEETHLPDQFRLLGRGELQFAILIEQMRREGAEFMVGKPEVLFKNDESTGERLEPFEKAVLDLPEAYASEVTSLFQQRKGVLTVFEHLGTPGTDSEHNRVRLMFEIPTRGLLGIRSTYLTLTRGGGLFSSLFLGYFPYKGNIFHRNSGALVSDRTGDVTEYALRNLEDRGVFFVAPGVKAYEGMIVGQNNKEDDININVVREKKLTNMRASHLEALVHLQGTRTLSLEDCLEWIEQDEWVEITPKTIRLRKKVLAGNQRSTKKEERMA